MDFQLISADSGGIDMTHVPVDGILNNIIISVSIIKGSWWHDPSFGLTDRPRMKNTPETGRLIRQDYEQALQWLIDAGRASKVDVTTWRDESNRHRLNVLISATQADGRVVTYTTFKEVV